ncbi:MAG: Hint domain-containing protein, partial [Promethearchaeota archaeon]
FNRNMNLIRIYYPVEVAGDDELISKVKDKLHSIFDFKVNCKFRFAGLPPDEAYKDIKLNPYQNIRDVIKIVCKEYKISPVLNPQLIFKGRILPENFLLNDLLNDGYNPEKDEITVQASQSGGCFSGDTYVMMSDGTKKKISDIRENDEILSYNPATDDFMENTVAHITKTFYTEAIDFGDGHVIARESNMTLAWMQITLTR